MMSTRTQNSHAAALHELSVVGLLEGYRTGRFSPVEVVAALCARVAEVDPVLNSVWARTFASAEHAAAQSERAYRDGVARPLEGIPFLVKDAIDTAEAITTNGSGIYRDNRPARDAVVVQSLREAGAILLGKAALHEFAAGSTGVNERLGTTHNPWDTDRIAGGSSGGSAAAVAAGLVPLALGTDTVGSIRMPSALCGVVGLKPSYGRVSVRGVWANVPSLDTVGPIARTVEDVELALAVMEGSARAAPPTPPAPPATLAGVAIASVSPWSGAEVSEAASAAVQACAATLERLGACVAEIEIPELALALDTFRTIQAFELPYCHALAGIYPDRLAEYGEDLRARLTGTMQGVAGRSADDYAAAGAARHRICAAFARAFADADILLMPTTPVIAPTLDEVEDLGRAEELTRTLLGHTATQAIAGVPACSVPVAWQDGLPLGVQLTGRIHADERMLEVGRALGAAAAVADPLGKMRCES